jgi:hypothetical protein
MRIVCLSLAVSLALAAAPAVAADASIVTIADGSARVLRGTVWYKLVAGAPFQEGDVIEAGERTTVQVELATGGTLNLVGPGSLYGAVVPQGGGKDPIEFGLDRGWLKFAAAAPGAGARLRTPSAVVSVSEAIFVAHQEGRLFELFVETGSAKLSEAGRTGRDGPSHDAKAGEYWSRDGDKPFTSERRAPVKFVASMPRHLIEKLASLAAKFKGKKPPLAVDREITLAEADPWLTGPYRRAFARRLGGRLADPTFRKAVEANIAAYPDFDRVLHPEKYPVDAAPPATGTAPAVPGAAKAPAAGTTPAPAAKAATTPPSPPPASPPGKPGAKTGALRWSPALSLLLPDTSEMLL